MMFRNFSKKIIIAGCATSQQVSNCFSASSFRAAVKINWEVWRCTVSPPRGRFWGYSPWEICKTLEIALLAQHNQDLHCVDRPRLCFKVCSCYKEREQKVCWYIIFKRFRVLTSQEKYFSPMIFTIVFSKTKPVVDDNFVLKTLGDFESQPAFAGNNYLFSDLCNNFFLCWSTHCLQVWGL